MKYHDIEDILNFAEISQDEVHPLEYIEDCEKVKVISKCAENPILFASICRVPSAEGFVKLNLYDKQKDIINGYIEDHYVIILGSRQTGKTTVTYAFIIWLLIFHGNYRVGILMQSDTTVKGGIKEVYDIYNCLPSWLQETCIIDNTKEKVFNNGSKLLGFAIDPKNPDGIGRSMKVDFMLIDEAAFIVNIDKAYRALKPVTSRRHLRLKNNELPYGTVIITTPNGTFGTGKWYYDFWTDSLKEINNFKAIKFHWSSVPEYDDEWFADTTSDMTERDINQEYELKFLGSNSAYLEDTMIENMQKSENIKQVIGEIKLIHGEIKLYKSLNQDTFYLIGADSADAGDDYAAMVIFDWLQQEVVGIYYDDKVASIDFTQDAYDAGMKIQNSLIIFEKNTIGATSVQSLYQQLGPSKIWVVRDRRFQSDSYKYAGISTNTHSRRLMFDSLYKFVKENPDKINAPTLIYELISLEKKGQRIEAAKGSHDDLALSFSFILYVMAYGNIEDYTSRFDIKGQADQAEMLDAMITDDQVVDKIDNLVDKFDNDVLNILNPDNTIINDNAFEKNTLQNIKLVNNLNNQTDDYYDSIIDKISEDVEKSNDLMDDIFSINK